MENAGLILTLSTGLAFAAVLGYLAMKFRLSPIVGYLVAGIIISPCTPGLSANQEIADQFAEIGVVLLMFGVGLEFHFGELLAVRRVAIPGALTTSLTIATSATLLMRFAIGMAWDASLLIALTLSVSSTVVLVRVLADSKKLHTPGGHIAVGWLVVEDLFTVLVLVVLPVILAAISGTDGGPSVAAEPLPGITPEGTSPTGELPGSSGNVFQTIVWSLGDALVKIGGLVAIVLIVGSRVIPFLLERVARTRSRELFTLTVLVSALGIAVASARFFDVSMAMGAFLAGMVIGRTEFSYRAAADAFPLRDAFAVLFFVSIGMLLDPSHLTDYPGAIVLILLIIMVVRPILAFSLILILRYPVRTAITVGLALAQIGEFSFVLGHLGLKLDVLSAREFNLVVIASMISITINPFVGKLARPLETLLQKYPKLWRYLNRRVLKLSNVHSDVGVTGVSHRTIIVGYGPIGRIVTRILQQNHIEPVIIEMNLNTVRHLHEHAIRAEYGDAAAIQTLRGAEIELSEALILSSDALTATADIIRQAKELNPKIRILVRTRYISQIGSLRAGGADGVFASEGELALAFAETLLRQLGATPGQIDRERARIRRELVGADSIEEAFARYYRTHPHDLRAPDAEDATSTTDDDPEPIPIANSVTDP
ncbi:MAG: cation:proton antiporter [Planctomycetia bacterium]|nr:cation:proton antiporter [Planctomycetia bacterium]